MTEEGWQVRSAPTVAEGLARVAGGIWCVVVDLILPEDGEAVLRRVREAHPSMRVVVLATRAEESARKASSPLMPGTVVQKPVEMDEFLPACSGGAADARE